MNYKKILLQFFIAICSLGFISVLGVYILYVQAKNSLPQILKVEDYEPLLVSHVYDRHNKKIGEFYRERRTLIPYEKIPDKLVKAFLAAEDDQFFKHKGVNFQAIFRAAIANAKAGRSVQGGSTITQQVAKTLLLSSEKTITRKIKDILLAMEMEKNLSKEDILYLYLNQIYFGAGAYGVEVAAQTYFKKPAAQLKLSEMAILAGLPQAPSRYSPIINPLRAKERQIYVLRRMAEVGFIGKDEAELTIQEPVKVYVREDYEQFAPYFLETVRQILIDQIGENEVLDKGIKIYTSLDLEDQKAANLSVQNGLKEVDKRQGYRGPLKNLNDEEEIVKYLEVQKTKFLQESTPERTILADGTFAEIVPTISRARKNKKIEPRSTKVEGENLPIYLKTGDNVEGIVEKVDDQLGLTYVRLPESQGIIDIETMTWARKPNPEKKADLDTIKKPSEALQVGDVILVKIKDDQFNAERVTKQIKAQELATKKKIVSPQFKSYVGLELDQEPIVEGSLISFDQQTQDVIAMVGGYSFARNEYNRSIQALRQTGSAFKALVYAAALDKGYTPSTPLLDVPVAYRNQGEEGQGDEKIWRPSNHGQGFNGEVPMRNALIKSLNLPSVKIIENIGVHWAIDYARRLGIFSPLNPDFTLVLGSSSITLYEMTKVFSQFGRLGKKLSPRMIYKVVDKNGKPLLQNITLDVYFQKKFKEFVEIDKKFTERREAYMQMKAKEQEVEAGLAQQAGTAEAQETAKPEIKSKNVKNQITDDFFFFDDPDQLIRPQTGYIITQMLKGVVDDPMGTGGRARALGRPVAAKTGSTNGYFDGWFIGYTPQVATGVWVGFDKERSIGAGEVGGRTALPIWLEFMKIAHQGLPVEDFPQPEGVSLVKVDAESGRLYTGGAGRSVDQAYLTGTEPTAASIKQEETTDFLKQDMTE